MYEFRVRVGMKGGGDQVFIVSAEVENEIEAEDQIRYLVENDFGGVKYIANKDGQIKSSLPISVLRFKTSGNNPVSL